MKISSGLFFVDATKLQIDTEEDQFRTSAGGYALPAAKQIGWTQNAKAMAFGWKLSIALMFGLVSAGHAPAQESPYVVTYDHYLEEPGNLEFEYSSAFGTQRHGHDFYSYWLDFEYGVKGWWTTEFYIDGQSTLGDSTIFTGFRWENRLRILQREHLVNPVLYMEYEQINEADRIIKEVEGHDIESDHGIRNTVARQTIDHELEFKLLLSSTFKGWNAAVNPLATKNLLPSNPWEFGYAVGASRPLALKASPDVCNFCKENFIAGIEMYGGLGDTQSFGLHQTSHYLAPVVAWNLPSGWTIRLSPGFGLNDDSHRLLLRWGLSREFFGSEMRFFAFSEATDDKQPTSCLCGPLSKFNYCRPAHPRHFDKRPRAGFFDVRARSSTS